GFAERAVGEAGADEAGLRVPGVAPVAGTAVEDLLHVGAAEALRHAGDGPVVIGVLHGLGGGFRLAVDGHVAEVHVVAQASVGAVGGAGDHGVQRRLAVDARYALEVRVGDDRDGVVADHGPGLLAVEGPDREDAVRADP